MKAGNSVLFIVVRFLSHVLLFATPWTAARQGSLSFTISWSLLKLTSVKSMMPSNHLILSSSSCPQSFPTSGSFLMSQLFTSRGQSIGTSASASVLPMNIQDWFPLGLIDLISAVQGSPESFEHHNWKASILWCSAFFMVQLSHPYMTTGKIIALTRQTFVGKAMSLLFNMLSRFVRAFLPRSKCLLTSWLQSLSTVLLEPRKIKSVTLYIVSPSICHEVMGLDAMIVVFWMLTFKTTFSLSFSPSSRGSLVSLHFLL